jgi:hypothetical protein
MVNLKFLFQKAPIVDKQIDLILSNRFVSSQKIFIPKFRVVCLFSNLEILCEIDLEKVILNTKKVPLTIPGFKSNLDPPFEEAHRPDGRPAERHWGVTEKRTSTQVVLSMSPRPGSAITGRTTTG